MVVLGLVFPFPLTASLKVPVSFELVLEHPPHKQRLMVMVVYDIML